MNSETLLWIIVVLGIVWKIVAHVRSVQNVENRGASTQASMPPVTHAPRLAPQSTHTRVHTPEPTRVPVQPRAPMRVEQRQSHRGVPKTNCYGELED
ncbi:MAG: hypothetical protein IPM54_38330 [Polyangiaceae bacterium]|nr:hypothetical protein [Polyangiaceae bacterium]